MPVLKMLMDLCSRSVDSVVLFYDEMASAISSDSIDLGITVSCVLSYCTLCVVVIYVEY